MKKLLPLWMFLPIFLVLAACSDNSEDIDRYYATVSTPKVTTTTPTSLTVTASVTGDLNQIVKKGFCYSAAASVPTHHPDFMDQVKTVFGYRGGLNGFISSRSEEHTSELQSHA